MKFTLSWLKDHLETSAGIEEIAERLTSIGLEVEEVFNPAAALNGFITAKVEKCEMHPDSDHLHLLSVNNGTETLQVVCGAPNVKLGTIGIFAPVGVVIPCYNEKLTVGKIRGVESFGMLCSEKELCIGEDHDGIIELPSDTKIGVPAAEILNIDPVIEISITPNRAECLGVRGVARDLAASGLGKLKPLEIKKPVAKFACPINIRVEAKEACPVYTGRYIKGVDNTKETPKWMKDRLSAIGLRPISPLVDVTNYLNYDLARPLHVFDADKLKGDLVIRMAKEEEPFISLEEKEYKLDSKSLGICDDEGVQCLGGVMGGLSKGCSDDTVNVLLESASFKPECIARTGRHFQIDSDSRYRYERWVDPNSNIMGSDYAASLILDICGGEASEIVVRGEEDYCAQPVTLRYERVKTLAGIDVSKEEIIRILTALGFKLTDKGDAVEAVSPTWRGDIEFEADLVEEVVRIRGLDSIPAVSIPSDEFPKQTLSPKQQRILNARHELASRGMFETVTWSFTDSKLCQPFRKGKAPVLLMNPIASELDEMRPSILPNLLIAAHNNIARNDANMALFEIGPEFYGCRPSEQGIVAAGIRCGMSSKKHWLKNERAYDVFDVKADALAAIAAANGPWENAQITTDTPEYYHPGRSGTLRLGKNVIAYFGEVHPLVLKSYDIKERVMAFEVFLNNIPLPRSNVGKAKKKLELSSLQALDKDLAFVVDKNVAAVNVVVAAKNADREYISDVRVFDVFEGGSLPEDKKSIALSVTFQPKDKTFTDQEIEGLMKKIILEVAKKTDGILRQ
ncbi:MAG: phenylalanine--tRNA ligase subunit beta [Alphaproteobacteria bacterium]|nr:phenylalanine--tRNA ligase subunit beta [Alphaproteobacteria bacterium]